jgi:thymidylate synthase (FAD)
MTKVLDHGYCKLVETWGSDQSIIESARMSTDKGFLGWGPKIRAFDKDDNEIQLTGWQHDNVQKHEHVRATLGVARWEEAGPGDEKLLRYLYENKHSTPFEFAGLTIEVQAPLMVFREWHRHRVPFGYSEQSARYVEMPELFYVPSAERLSMGGQSKTNKQSSGAALPDAVVEETRLRIDATSRRAFAEYRAMIADGVAKELARLVLPVNTYSRMRATGNLRGWLGFLTLRTAPGAQWEIREYANVVGSLIAEKFPRTWQLFSEQKR